MSLSAVTINPICLSEPDINNYWQHYGLIQDPFAIELQERYYVPIARWEQYLDLLQFLCHNQNTVLAVTGNSCSGKSTLLKQFVQYMHDAVRIAEFKAVASFTPEQLILLLAEQFTLAANPTASLVEQFDESIMALQQSPSICLLLIDNAHLLSNQVLQWLFYLIQQQSEMQMKLHIVLFGEPHLQHNLTRMCQAEGKSEALFHVLDMGLLSLEETEKYLHYRLSTAGFQDTPLAQTVINRIYKLSCGAPGRINRIAKRTLLNELIKHQPIKKKGMMVKNSSLIIGGLLLILGFIAFFIFSYLMQPNDKLAIFPWKKTVVATVNKQAMLPIAIKDSEANVTLPSSPLAQEAQMLQATLAAANATQLIAQPIIIAPPTVKKTINTSAEHTAVVKAKLLKMAAAYSIQLSGLSSRAAVQRFLAEHPLGDKVNYYRTVRDDKAWYIILYGSFNSPAEAKAAIKTLPEPVQRLKPWVRSYASVAAAIW